MLDQKTSTMALRSLQRMQVTFYAINIDWNDTLLWGVNGSGVVVLRFQESVTEQIIVNSRMPKW